MGTLEVKNSIRSRRLGRILKANTPQAYHIAYRASGSAPVAERAVRETLLLLTRDPPGNLSDEQLAIYFFKLARRGALSLLKSEARPFEPGRAQIRFRECE